MYEAPGLAAGGELAGSATIERYESNAVTVGVSTDSAALLVLSDTFYPGWVAKVDGAEVRILQANLCQRAVVVPAGGHTVEFEFRPRTVYAGFAVSLGSLLVGCALLVGLARRR
jgi:uncharacterized membrane protein YfhO